jgi:hypothetical protein
MMATITETSNQPSETASAPAAKSSMPTDRKKHEFRVRVIYCEFLPEDFLDKLRTVPIPYSEILNTNGDSTTFVQDWLVTGVLPRVWPVVANFFRSWQIDESVVDSIKAPFADRSNDEIGKAIKDCLCFSELKSPTDMISVGALKKMVKQSYSEQSSLTVNLAFSGALHPIIRAAFQSSLTLWQEVNAARLEGGADLSAVVDEVGAMFERQIERVLSSSPAPQAKRPPVPLHHGTPRMPPKGARLNPAFSRAMGVTPSPPASLLHRAADGNDVLTQLGRCDGYPLRWKKAFRGSTPSNDRNGYPELYSLDMSDDRGFGDDPNNYFGGNRKTQPTFSHFSKSARINESFTTAAVDDVTWMSIQIVIGVRWLEPQRSKERAAVGFFFGPAFTFYRA